MFSIKNLHTVNILTLLSISNIQTLTFKPCKWWCLYWRVDSTAILKQNQASYFNYHEIIKSQSLSNASLSSHICNLLLCITRTVSKTNNRNPRILIYDGNVTKILVVLTYKPGIVHQWSLACVIDNGYLMNIDYITQSIHTHTLSFNLIIDSNQSYQFVSIFKWKNWYSSL